jgi:predicted nucleotidyltransferase
MKGDVKMTEARQPWDNLILRVHRGSTAYGTNITKQMAKQTGLKESDHDFMGICVPPREYLYGLLRFEQHEEHVPNDETTFALDKFMHLAWQNNPNILEILFTPRNYTTFIHPVGEHLLENRHLFLSKEVYHRFGGYAYSQIKRLEVKKEAMTGRRDLAEKYGYDTKFGMHAVRLLKMGIEILVEEDLCVHRPDAEELRDIRMGKYTLDELTKYVDGLREKLDLAYINSDLPAHAPIDKISRLCKELHDMYWEREPQNA